MREIIRQEDLQLFDELIYDKGKKPNEILTGGVTPELILNPRDAELTDDDQISHNLPQQEINVVFVQ